MPKKYTTFQVDIDIADHVRLFCKERGLIIAKTTELIWANFISSSNSPNKELSS
jgi:hypothetical protein